MLILKGTVLIVFISVISCNEMSYRIIDRGNPLHKKIAQFSVNLQCSPMKTIEELMADLLGFTNLLTCENAPTSDIVSSDILTIIEKLTLRSSPETFVDNLIEEIQRLIESMGCLRAAVPDILLLPFLGLIRSFRCEKLQPIDNILSSILFEPMKMTFGFPVEYKIIPEKSLVPIGKIMVQNQNNAHITNLNKILQKKLIEYSNKYRKEKYHPTNILQSDYEKLLKLLMQKLAPLNWKAKRNNFNSNGKGMKFFKNANFELMDDAFIKNTYDTDLSLLMKSLGTPVNGIIENVVGETVTEITGNVENVANKFNKILGLANGVVKNDMKISDKKLNTVSGVVEGLKANPPVIGFVQELTVPGVGIISDGVGKTLGTVTGAADNVLNSVNAVADGVTGNIVQILNGATGSTLGTITGTIEGTMNAVEDKVTNVVSTVGNVADGILQVTGSSIGALENIAEGKLNTVTGAVDNVLNLGAIEGVVDGVLIPAEGVLGAVTGVIENVAGSKINSLTDILDETLMSLASVLQNLIGNLVCKPKKSIIELCSNIFCIADNLHCYDGNSLTKLVSVVLKLISTLTTASLKSQSDIMQLIVTSLREVKCVSLVPIKILTGEILNLLNILSCEKLSSLKEIKPDFCDLQFLPNPIKCLSSGNIDVIKNLSKNLINLMKNLQCSPQELVSYHVIRLLNFLDSFVCYECENVSEIANDILELIKKLGNGSIQCSIDLAQEFILILKKFKCSTLEPVEVTSDKLLGFITNLNCKNLHNSTDILKGLNSLRRLPKEYIT